MADGWHKEMSLHYHISAVADFYETIRLIQANKLTSKLDPEFNEYLRNAAEVLIHFTIPIILKKVQIILYPVLMILGNQTGVVPQYPKTS